MSKHKNIPFLSPEKYIRTKARSLPLGTCYLNQGWKESGMAFIIVTREHVNGNLTFAIIQVDLHCLGVKDAFWNFNVSSLEVDKIIETQNENSNGEDPLTEVDYVLVHNIIYGAVEYAEELGFKPHKDFNLVQYILEEDDEHIELMEIEFGLNGQPAIYIGKEQHPKNIIAQLNRSVGEGNYRIIDQEDDQEEELSDEHLFNLAEAKNKEMIESPDDIEIIDKSIEEIDDKDLEDVFMGRKRLSELNFFLFVFAIMMDGLKKAERKEVDQILKEIETWNISDESPDELDYFESGEEKQCFESLSELCESNPESAIKPLQEAILRYPLNFSLYNLLGSVYDSLGDLELMDTLAREMYLKFPDYVVAACNYMNRLFITERYDEFAEIMDKSFNIHEQFPGRNCFSPNELLPYLVSVINYHLKQDEVVKAAAYTFPLTVYVWEDYSEKIANLFYQVVGSRIAELFLEGDIRKFRKK
jgi:hypothetical protein